MPNCNSKPSLVVAFGVVITPALLISRSSDSNFVCSSSDAARMDASDVRSSSCTVTSPPMRAAA